MLEKIFSESKGVIFDLEVTSWPGANERNWNQPGEHKEIIQIGAVKIETKEDMKEISNFQVLVRSMINPILSDYITNLTRITQKKIERDGISFPQALKRFTDFIGKHPINILFNGNDKDVIEENCLLHKKPFPFIFSKTVNLKLYF